MKPNNVYKIDSIIRYYETECVNQKMLLIFNKIRETSENIIVEEGSTLYAEIMRISHTTRNLSISDSLSIVINFAIGDELHKLQEYLNKSFLLYPDE